MTHRNILFSDGVGYLYLLNLAASVNNKLLFELTFVVVLFMYKFYSELLLKLFALLMVCSNLFVSPILLSTAQAEVSSNASKEPIVKKFQAWSLLCDKVNVADANLCEMQQSSQNVFEPEMLVKAVIFKIAGQNTAIFRLFVPNTIELSKAVQMQIGSNKPESFTYRRCVGSTCIAELPIDAARLQLLKTANYANILIARTIDKTTIVKIDLSGFAKAFDNLKSI